MCGFLKGVFEMLFWGIEARKELFERIGICLPAMFWCVGESFTSITAYVRKGNNRWLGPIVDLACY